MDKWDVVIIGAGPIGIACALEAEKKGLNYVVIEKGCLVNSIYNYPRNMTFFSTSERLEIDGIPFISSSPKPTRTEALEYYRRVAVERKLKIHLFEKVNTIIARKPGEFILHTDKANYSCVNLVIASGFYDFPYLLNIPGEDLPKVRHYYDDPHYYAFQKVLIIGAMNSAVDAALETWRKGAEVTIVVRGSEIGSRVKYWVRPDIENRILEGSIKAYFNTTVEEILPTEVRLKTPQGRISVPNNFVIAMTGYQPNLDMLRNCGINLDQDNHMKPDYNEDTHESNVSGIYLAGVICGGLNTHKLFIENSREHAVAIMSDIASKTECGEI